MLVCKWENLPEFMQIPEVRPYWEILRRRNLSLFFKRLFDVVVSSLLLFLCCPLFLVLSVAIRIDSEGPVFYRQERVTQYGKRFKIHKFRSMVVGSDKASLITAGNDSRITKVGNWIRKFKLDELPQLIDVLNGKMSFVGPRPEVPKYVSLYSPEYYASFLLPAGITSRASVLFKDENDIFQNVTDVDRVYTEEILPMKMSHNLEELKLEGVFYDLKLLFMTFFALCGK